MHLCRKLSSGEVIVLKTTYEIANKKDWDPNDIQAGSWLTQVAYKSGLKYPELIEVHERGLIEKNLLTDRTHSDRSGVNPGDHYRLTGLGFEICQFIENYDDLSEDKGGKR